MEFIRVRALYLVMATPTVKDHTPTGVKGARFISPFRKREDTSSPDSRGNQRVARSPRFRPVPLESGRYDRHRCRSKSVRPLPAAVGGPTRLGALVQKRTERESACRAAYDI